MFLAAIGNTYVASFVVLSGYCCYNQCPEDLVAGVKIGERWLGNEVGVRIFFMSPVFTF